MVDRQLLTQFIVAKVSYMRENTHELKSKGSGGGGKSFPQSGWTFIWHLPEGRDWMGTKFGSSAEEIRNSVLATMIDSGVEEWHKHWSSTDFFQHMTYMWSDAVSDGDDVAQITLFSDPTTLSKCNVLPLRMLQKYTINLQSYITDKRPTLWYNI